jgi:hypothetical protein
VALGVNNSVILRALSHSISTGMMAADWVHHIRRDGE